MVMALCTNSIPLSSSIFKSSSFPCAHISRCVRPVITVTKFTHRFPSTTVLSSANLSTHAAAITPSSLVNDIQSNGIYSHFEEEEYEEEEEEETDWLLAGCDFEHWLVVMEEPEGEPTRDEIIDTYIKTLSKVLGSEEKARMKIYSVSTRCYFAFGALVSEELSYKIKKLPGVRWVLPDSYIDEGNEDYGGEPFINGKAVPYDPKYHEVWIRNNSKRLAKEREVQLKSSPDGDVQTNTGSLQHDAHGENNMGGTPPPNAPNARDPNNNMPNNNCGECGPPEDSNNHGNYQLGRATIVDN